MIHLKGILWLLAWSLWFVLGVGLYKELPRSFGKTVCELQTDQSTARVLGFVADSNQIVLLIKTLGVTGLPFSTVNIVDAETGAVLRKTYGYFFPNGNLGDAADQCRKGVLFTRLQPNSEGKMGPKGVFVLDLHSMEWRTVSDRNPAYLSLHPNKSLILFESDRETFLLDFRTLRETFVVGDLSGSRAAPFFLEGGKRIAVVGRSPSESPESRESRIEIWNIDPDVVREGTIESVAGFVMKDHSDSGRVLIIGGTQTAPTVDVFDVHEKRMMFAGRPSSEGIGSKTLPRVGTPCLSKSGRSLIGSDPPSLWNVDTGEIIWRPNRCEDTWAQDSQEVFNVRENWHKLWEQWRPNLKFTTFAYRSLEDGGLLHRTNSLNTMRPKLWNAAGTLAVAEDGNVYRLPLPVNWPLLALCQAVLSSPLIILWTLLRWRKNRRARFAAAAP